VAGSTTVLRADVDRTPPLLFGGSGKLARLIGNRDWSDHPFGPIEGWSRALRSAMTFMLDAAFPAAMWIGPELRLVYNDAYAPILGPRHPDALGRPGREVWGELWDVIGPQFAQVMTTGKGIVVTNQMLPMTRLGYVEETFWDYSLSPLTTDDGTVAGVFNEARDVTAAAQQQRHDRLLIDLDEKFGSDDAIDPMIDAALRLIGDVLSAKRTGYGEIIDGSLHIRRCWTSATMPDICGHYPLGTFGAISAELAQGTAVRIEDNRTDPRTSDAQTVARYDAIGLRSGIVIPILDRGRYAGGVFVQDDSPRRWTDCEVALAEAASKRLWQALVRARAETALRESEERFRLIFEQANDIIFTADIDQRITAANPAGARALGFTPEAIIGRSIADFVSPEDFAQTTAMLRHKLDQGGHTRHEVGVTGFDGKAMRWENDSTLIVDRDAKPIGLLSISRDVTERRAFDARRELLIHELNHRVKNTLSLVQGIAHQSFRAGADPVAAPAEFEARLRALAIAHDLLTRDQWEGAVLAELVRGATAHFGGADSRIAIEGPHLMVPPKAAVALVMALHELATNAVKYGALSNGEGRIVIRWTQEADDCFKLVWTEFGGPQVSAPTRRGFGVRMIERALASDLGGKVVIEFAQTGVICTIDAPIDGVTP